MSRIFFVYFPKFTLNLCLIITPRKAAFRPKYCKQTLFDAHVCFPRTSKQSPDTHGPGVGFLPDPLFRYFCQNPFLYVRVFSRASKNAARVGFPPAWLSALVEKILLFLAGMAVLRSISFVMMPPTVSIPHRLLCLKWYGGNHEKQKA